MLGLLCLVLALGVGAEAQVASPIAPAGVAYDAAGNLYIADAKRNIVYEQTVGGVLRVFAGTGEQGFDGDGGAATSALLNEPMGVAVDAAGVVYIVDSANDRVRAVDVSGVIRTVAGTGVGGFAGDGGVATAARLRSPQALAVRADGSLLIADTGNQRVRLLDASGLISTFAGTGEQGFSGDGGLATAALLDTPAGVAVFGDGRVVIADSRNHRLRVVDAAGVITAFAGTGVRGFSGDGDAAVSAKLFLPRGVVVLADGTTVVFADSNNQRVRAVPASGVISTLVASGVQGSAADGVAASMASLNNVRGVAVSPYGAVVVADVSNRVVRALLADNDIYNVASMGGARVSVVTMTATATAASVAVSSAIAVPQGAVQVVEGSTVLASGSLDAKGQATMALPALASGTHMLQAMYAGDGFNPAATSASVSLTSGASMATATTLSVPALNYAGLPVTLSAKVSASGGTPTGTVSFLNGGSVVATAALVNGLATAAWLNAAAGTYSVEASYAGDATYLPSRSATQTASVSAMPDFTVQVVGASQVSVPAGSVASYTLQVGSVQGAFSGAVSMSASGLPSSTTATFAPGQVVPGTSGATVVLSVPTDKLLAQSAARSGWWLALVVPALLCARRRRVLAIAPALFLLVGCGARVASESAVASKSYTVTITGTGTNLAGVAVTHSTVVMLTVQ
ncbi:MAG: Ig-like domain repeat protein [Acidobacteriaceae bacterium]|nr:Ig-like domain repeat protein [Acidobacteriaceae bacterium]